MKFKNLINEKEESVASIVKRIVKELQGPNFSMGKSPNDGNGYAMVKAGKIVIHDTYYFQDKKRMGYMKTDWSKDGTYGKYFNDEYGVTFKVDSVKDIPDSKKYQGMFGYYEVIISVTK